MKNTRILFYSLLMTVCIAFCSTAVFADDLDGSEDDTQDVPIDGGISLLVAAGVGYGAKKLHHLRKQQKSTDENI